jgi:Pre ATP-grasp domain
LTYIKTIPIKNLYSFQKSGAEMVLDMVVKPMSEELKKSRLSLPISSCCKSLLTENDTKRLAELSDRLMRDEPALVSSRNFGSLIQQGLNDCPALIIGDQREINLFSQEQVSQLDHRMALLAQPNDTVIVNRRDIAFEQYLANYLQLDGINFVEGASESTSSFLPVSVRCRTDGRLRSLIGKLCAQAGGLLLLPYLTTGNIWRLAQEIADDTGRPIAICGPSPRISTHVNNKIWFTNCVQQIIGDDAAPPTFSAYGPAAAAARVAKLSKVSKRVVVKIPDSAGSAGNIAFESEQIVNLPLSTLRQKLISLLHVRGWQDRYPILISVWDCDVISSPSVHIWIPLKGDGLPIIEHIFEQVVQGTEGEFIGARPAVLSQSLNNRLIAETTQLATVFQNLGFFGRCSLDAIVSRRSDNTKRLHWIECNGRWGGVSIPLTLTKRLAGYQPYQGLVIVQHPNPELPIRSTDQVVDTLKDILFKFGSTLTGIILLSPVYIDNDLQVNFLAVAEDQKTAESLAEDCITRLQHS